MTGSRSCQEIEDYRVGSFEVGQGSGEKLGFVEAITPGLDGSTQELPEGPELVLVAGHRSGPEDLLCKREQLGVSGQPGAKLLIT
jgi:hypothetical protein